MTRLTPLDEIGDALRAAGPSLPALAGRFPPHADIDAAWAAMTRAFGRRRPQAAVGGTGTGDP